MGLSLVPIKRTCIKIQEYRTREMAQHLRSLPTLAENLDSGSKTLSGQFTAPVPPVPRHLMPSSTLHRHCTHMDANRQADTHTCTEIKAHLKQTRVVACTSNGRWEQEGPWGLLATQARPARPCLKNKGGERSSTIPDVNPGARTCTRAHTHRYKIHLLLQSLKIPLKV